MQPWVREADGKLTAAGGCARVGMDDGYMVGPREVVFKVLAEFAEGIKQRTGCKRVPKKCKMYNLDPTTWHDCKHKNLIPEEPMLMEEGIYVNENGDMLRGVTVFDVPIGELEYVETVLKNKAREVAGVARKYIEDLEEDYPQEQWTVLQYSLQHKITYWLRTCATEETEAMAEIVDAAIMKVCHATICNRFGANPLAKDRLRLPARRKGGGVRSMVDLRRPAFLGAILNIQPKCIDRRGSNGEETHEFYSNILTESIGKGAYDQDGHRNDGFL
jgi:hypothetical protein